VPGRHQIPPPGVASHRQPGQRPPSEAAPASEAALAGAAALADGAPARQRPGAAGWLGCRMRTVRQVPVPPRTGWCGPGRFVPRRTRTSGFPAFLAVSAAMSFTITRPFICHLL